MATREICEMCKRQKSVITIRLDDGEEWRVCEGCHNAVEDEKWDDWLENWLEAR